MLRIGRGGDVRVDEGLGSVDATCGGPTGEEGGRTPIQTPVGLRGEWRCGGRASGRGGVGMSRVERACLPSLWSPRRPQGASVGN